MFFKFHIWILSYSPYFNLELYKDICIISISYFSYFSCWLRGNTTSSTSVTPTPFGYQWYQRDLYCLYSWVSHLARFNELNWVLSYSWPFCIPVARAQEWTHFIAFSFLLSNRHGFWGNRLNKQGLFCISFLRWNQIMKDFPVLYLQIFPFTKALAAWIHYSRHFYDHSESEREDTWLPNVHTSI